MFFVLDKILFGTDGDVTNIIKIPEIKLNSHFQAKETITII